MAQVSTEQASLKELLDMTFLKQKIPQQQVFVPKELLGMHEVNTITTNGYGKKAPFEPIRLLLWNPNSFNCR